MIPRIELPLTIHYSPFTIYGFYSIACARNNDGKLDTDTVMVRARTTEHLQNLKDKFPQIATEIISSKDTDYRYRLVMPKAQWLAILQDIGQEQDWSNFKNKVHQSEALCGRGYSNSLHEVWDVMHKLQKQ